MRSKVTQITVFRFSFRFVLASALLFLRVAGAQEIEEIRNMIHKMVDLVYEHQFQKILEMKEQARSMALRSLAAHEKTLGADSPELIPYLQIAGSLSLPDNRKLSLQYHRRALQIAEKAYGKESAKVADCLEALSGVPQGMNQSAEKAEENRLQQQAFEMRKRLFGDHHPETAKSLIVMAGDLAAGKGKAAAQEQLLEVLEIFETDLQSKDYKEFEEILEYLPQSYADYSDEGTPRISPKEFKRRTYALISKLSGKTISPGEDPELLRRKAEKAIGENISKGIALYEDLLKLLIAQHGDTATRLLPTLINLGAHYLQSGQYEKIPKNTEQILKVVNANPSCDPMVILGALEQTVGFMEFTGDYERAVVLRLKMLEVLIGNKKGKTDQVDTADMEIKIGRNYQLLGEREKAEKFFQKAMSAKRSNPDDNLGLLFNMKGLAGLYFDRGEDQKAAPLYRKFIEILEKDKLPVGGFYDTFLRKLAVIAHRTGKLEEAHRLFTKAQQVQNFPDYEDRALLSIDLGKKEEGISLAQRSEEEHLKAIRRVFAYGSERQRLALTRSFDPYTLWIAQDRPYEIARNVLRYKGLVLDSLLEDRRLAALSRNDPDLIALEKQLSLAKKELIQAQYQQTISKNSPPKATGEGLVEKVESLQNQFALRISGLGRTRQALSVLPEQIQKALPANSALVEMLLCQRYLGNRRSEAYYGAIVLVPGRAPKWVNLSSASTLEKLIKRYRKSVRGHGDEESLQESSKGLFAAVWKPLEEALPEGTTTVILSPDGMLHSVSFAALTTPGGSFLAEKYSLRYVTSGRDLLAKSTSENPSSKDISVFANPNFSAEESVPRPANIDSEESLTEKSRGDLQRYLQLPELPGTLVEANSLETKLSAQGWKVDLRMGKEATKAGLFSLKTPRILHLATHGFFLPTVLGGDATAKDVSLPPNPMLRSGIALSSAQNTLDAWKAGRVPPRENDGIVTAEEVGVLQLDGTWIVALSACETGGGEVQAGEGVLGLRRGFTQAGVQNLLMTLWPIQDQTTAMIMVDYYERALKTNNASQALADTQREWLVKLREEKGLYQAVNLAGPFVVSFQGAVR